MNYTVIKKLPPIEDIIQKFPLSIAAHEAIARSRQEVKNILAGNDKRFLLIVGPCSAWPKEAVIEYADRLVSLNKEVQHALKIVMRVYINKPRTTKGWRGAINQPDIFASSNFELGVQYAREMMMRVVEKGLPIADEALFTHNYKGFLDLLSWVAIGARSAEDQEHRIFASALDCAVGLKNPTHGEIAVGVNSVVAAQHADIAVLDGYEVQTHGNPYAHLVLRGANNSENYSSAHLLKVKMLMDKYCIKNQSVIIDASHDNCWSDGKKDYNAQPNIVLKIVESLKEQPTLRALVKGFMIESFLKDGRQDVDISNPQMLDLQGLSITDPCLSWEKTEDFILKLAAMHHL